MLCSLTFEMSTVIFSIRLTPHYFIGEKSVAFR
jgi:hypothetical protein